MGAYINPPEISKEKWLRQNAIRIPKSEAKVHTDFDDKLVVALLDNMAFTAACIAFNENELRAVTLDNEHRIITYYKSPKAELLKVSNLKEYL